MKNALIIVSALLLLSLGGNVYQVYHANLNRELRLAQNRYFQDIQVQAKVRFDSAEVQKNRKLSKIASERDSFKVALVHAKAEIARHKRNATATRPKIQVLVDTIPDLRDFVAYQDSTIASQDSLIANLELRHSAEIVDLEEVVRLMRFQIQEQVLITNSLQGQVVEEQANTRKERRAKKFYRTLSVIGAAGIGILLLKP